MRTLVTGASTRVNLNQRAETIFCFTLAFRQYHYHIKTASITAIDGRQPADDLYLVEITTPAKERSCIVYSIDKKTGQAAHCFKAGLHPDIINKIGEAIVELTS